jgi:hypothetical protein
VNDLGTHIALFLAIAVAIVALGTFYSEADDARALRSFPKRFLTFVLGCGVVVAVMLICEHTFASIN